MTTKAKTAKTIKTIKPATATGRGTVVRLATAAVLAGMAAAATGGTAAAAPHAPLPSFTGYGTPTTTDTTGSDTTGGDTNGNNDGGGRTLESLLLSATQASSVVGVSGLKQTESDTKLNDDSSLITPVSCISTYAPAEASAYTGTPQAVAQYLIKDAQHQHVITESVVAFSDKQGAISQMKATLTQWKQCADATIAGTRPDSSGASRSWTNGKPQLNDDHTVLSLIQTESDGSGACERAIAAYSSVVIDVMYCTAGSTAGQGVAVANAIAERASSQPA